MTSDPHAYPDRPEFDYSRFVLELKAERNRDWARKPWVGLCVSQGWPDTDWLEEWVDKLAQKYQGTTILHTGRRGAAKVALQRADEMGFKLVEVESHPFWGNGRQAVQASHLCQLADVVMCFWAGSADGVKEVIDKALLVHRPAPQFDPGLHVWETVKTKATKSRKSQRTGRIRYRTREEFSLVEPKPAPIRQAA
jgi:hypothetical protein